MKVFGRIGTGFPTAALLLVLLVGGVALLFTHTEKVFATPGSMFFSTPLAVGLLEETHVKAIAGPRQFVEFHTKGFSDVHITGVRVPPGGHSGWHTHPGPSIVTVVAGTVSVYSGDDPTCTPKHYTAGSSWVDEGGGHVHMVRNEGGVDLEQIAFQVVPAGSMRRIDAPNPGHCPF